MNAGLEPKEKIRWQPLVAKYQVPSLSKSYGQLATSILPYIGLWIAMYFSLSISYWLTLLLAIPTAGFLVRIFIIFHDCGHGSFFKSRRELEFWGFITGVLSFTPYRFWWHEHSIHHASAGNLDKRGIGDVLTLTVEDYLRLPWWKKALYRIMRNPFFLFTIGSFWVFTINHRFWRFGKTGKREIMGVIYTNLALLALYGTLMYFLGWQAVVAVQVPILFIASSVGVWLFYVQHNFDGAYWERQPSWDFFKAGIEGSSFYKLPKVLQWFTGNIGFHHIHHLSPKIPNYNLEKCYKENPLFQVKPLTLALSLKSLFIRLYDEKTHQMVGWSVLKNYSRNSA